MAVYLEVVSRLDERAAAARKAVETFARAGDDISKGLGKSLAGAFGALDTGAARRDINEALVLINRLQRRYLNGDERTQPHPRG